MRLKLIAKIKVKVCQKCKKALVGGICPDCYNTLQPGNGYNTSGS